MIGPTHGGATKMSIPGCARFGQVRSQCRIGRGRVARVAAPVRRKQRRGAAVRLGPIASHGEPDSARLRPRGPGGCNQATPPVLGARLTRHRRAASRTSPSQARAPSRRARSRPRAWRGRRRPRIRRAEIGESLLEPLVVFAVYNVGGYDTVLAEEAARALLARTDGPKHAQRQLVRGQRHDVRA